MRGENSKQNQIKINRGDNGNMFIVNRTTENMWINLSTEAEVTGQELYFCLCPHSLSLSEVVSPVCQLTFGKTLIPANERLWQISEGEGPHQFVYSVIICSRHLDCVLAEHQQPCRDCGATQQLHWPLICMNSRLVTAENSPNDRWTYGVQLQKKATSRKYLELPQSQPGWQHVAADSGSDSG